MHRRRPLSARSQPLAFQALEPRICLAGEVLALELNVRDPMDAAMTSTGQRIAEIEIDEIVFLEVSYRDLRFNPPGAYFVGVDIDFSDATAMEPIVSEVQNLVFEGTLDDATTGTIVATLEGTGLVKSWPRGVFVANPESAISEALIEFGYSEDQFDIRELNPGSLRLAGQSEIESQDNFVYQVRYGLALEGQDLPALTFGGSPSTNVETQTFSEPPRLPDGTINPAVLVTSIDTRSRSTTDAGGFGTSIYTAQSGSFNEASGFETLGVMSPFAFGGIPGFLGVTTLPDPVDSFSIPIRVLRPVDALEVSVRMSLTDPILVFFEDDPLQENQVLLGPESQLTIDATDPNANAAPETDGPLRWTANENDEVTKIDLLQGVSDPNGDELTFTSWALVSGDASGVEVNLADKEVVLTPDRYDRLQEGQGEAVVFTYTIADPEGLSVTRDATITIIGRNDAPISIPDTFTVDAGVETILDLLGNDQDPDGESLTIASLTAPAPVGTVVLNADHTVSFVSPPGFQGDITFSYTASDPFGLTTTAQVNVQSVSKPIQKIASSQPVLQAFVDTVVEVPVLYSTLNIDGDAEPLPSTLLDFNLHFDSSKLEFIGLRPDQSLTEGRVASTIVADSLVPGDDGDPTTDFVLRTSYTDSDGLQTPGWPNELSSFPLQLYIAQFRALEQSGSSEIHFSANQFANVVGQATSLAFAQESIRIDFQDVTGDIDGDSDFDANDALMTHLAFLGASDEQLQAFKGSSPLPIEQIRQRIEILQGSQRLDIDQDDDTDANDSFLAQLIQLGATNAQLDQFKGQSAATAIEMRQQLASLGNGIGSSVGGSLVAFKSSVSGDAVAANATQRIAADVGQRLFDVGEILEIPVAYSTVDSGGAAAALQANLLDVNLHYDSSRLTFLGFELGQGIQEGRVVADELPENATRNDNVDATDRVLRTSFTDDDALVSPGWPNNPTADPQLLYVARFEVGSIAGPSTIYFTSNQQGNVVGQARAFSFVGEPFWFDVDDTVDVDVTPPRLTAIQRAVPVDASTAADRLTFAVQFDEPVTAVDAADFVVVGAGAMVTDIQMPDPNTFLVEVSGGTLRSYNGTLGLTLSGTNDITDIAGNRLRALQAGIPIEVYDVGNLESIRPMTSFTVDPLQSTIATLEFETAEDVVLNGWIDFDFDGNFSTSEQVFVNRQVVAGKALLAVDISAGVAAGFASARFEWGATAAAASGESSTVEERSIELRSSSQGMTEVRLPENAVINWGLVGEQLEVSANGFVMHRSPADPITKVTVYGSAGDDLMIVDPEILDFEGTVVYSSGGGRDVLRVDQLEPDSDRLERFLRRVEGIEQISFTNGNRDSVLLQSADIAKLPGTGQRLRVDLDFDDSLKLPSNQFSISGSRFVEDELYVIASSTTAEIEIGGLRWTNPLDRFDVDGSGKVNELDALMVINQLNRRSYLGDGFQLIPPRAAGEVFPMVFFDPSRDDKVTPWDALTVINRLNRLNRTEAFTNRSPVSFDGDARQDLVGFQDDQAWVARSTGSQFETSAWGAWDSSIDWVNMGVGDFDGDGKRDVIGRDEQGQWTVGLSTGTGFDAQVWGVWERGVPWQHVQFGDVDGDGRTDIVGYLNGAWRVSLSQGDRFVDEAWGNWDATVVWQDVLLADVDGDGRADVLGRDQNGNWLAGISAGNAFVNIPWGQWQSTTLLTHSLIGDFDGDGRSDVFGHDDAGFQVGLSTAAGLQSSTWLSNSTATTLSLVDLVDLRVLDANGDGRDDVAGRVDGRWSVALSTGDRFQFEQWGDAWDDAESEGNWRDVTALDLNGDGRDDLVGRRDGQWTAAISSGNDFQNQPFGQWEQTTWNHVQTSGHAVLNPLSQYPDTGLEPGLITRTIDEAIADLVRDLRFEIDELNNTADELADLQPTIDAIEEIESELVEERARMQPLLDNEVSEIQLGPELVVDQVALAQSERAVLGYLMDSAGQVPAEAYWRSGPSDDALTTADIQRIAAEFYNELVDDVISGSRDQIRKFSQLLGPASGFLYPVVTGVPLIVLAGISAALEANRSVIEGRDATAADFRNTRDILGELITIGLKREIRKTVFPQTPVFLGPVLRFADLVKDQFASDQANSPGKQLENEREQIQERALEIGYAYEVWGRYRGGTADIPLSRWYDSIAEAEQERQKLQAYTGSFGPDSNLHVVRYTVIGGLRDYSSRVRVT